MLKLENTEVLGWEHAIRGMRNPYSIEGAENNSWDKSDSAWTINDFEDVDEESGDVGRVLYKDPFVTHIHYELGKNDANLMMRLANGGPVHAKYRRMIAVYVDITAPLYWWKEFDTYKVGTVANSCSTMHKIAAKKFTLEDFSCEHLIIESEREGILNWGDVIPMEALHIIVRALNESRIKYLQTNDKRYWWQMIQLLPSSYNQRRTVQMNYEVLANIYKFRKDHKLDEWRELCKWIEGLPYSELITGKREEDLVIKIPKDHISPEALEMIEKGLTTDISIGFEPERNNIDEN